MIISPPVRTPMRLPLQHAGRLSLHLRAMAGLPGDLPTPSSPLQRLRPPSFVGLRLVSSARDLRHSSSSTFSLSSIDTSSRLPVWSYPSSQYSRRGSEWGPDSIIYQPSLLRARAYKRLNARDVQASYVPLLRSSRLKLKCERRLPPNDPDAHAARLRVPNPPPTPSRSRALRPTLTAQAYFKFCPRLSSGHFNWTTPVRAWLRLSSTYKIPNTPTYLLQPQIAPKHVLIRAAVNPAATTGLKSASPITAGRNPLPTVRLDRFTPTVVGTSTAAHPTTRMRFLSVLALPTNLGPPEHLSPPSGTRTCFAEPIIVAR
ncbi:hypothetical protein B0H15DRAFT_1025775 [Mycena belliarum]|uniref:Uncharacterized protein n=1 Tax=Mycena belliarum TaxID=1033014 RepID=A0AAD6XH56_9AGAR|nr:hypothetical protein B0H15DRAFT_1025775 [Mycena belliae]